ncbi:hypothetical protein D4764_06G0006870 [Takifugu flavidus]|uniref:Uncharacterized protein n=1 Tax=Takifugu flavidus TaxID=433684 RepID=A0A5C6N0F3_9TELE|nr:hypothetical protein D4764_06G0006870 [Takifugu flavidus]
MEANAGLSRKHGVKVGAVSVLSVEEVVLAVGQKIGHSSVKSAARMNTAVVLFLENEEITSPNMKILSRWKSPLLRHVVSHHRQVQMILNKAEGFNYRIIVHVDKFDYTLFATRLKEAMEQVLHRDQTYWSPSRSMVDNVHLIWDVLEVSGSLGVILV